MDKSPGEHWPAFAKKPKRLVRDAIRLRKQQSEVAAQTFASRKGRRHGRLNALIAASWKDRHARRLAKRPKRHRHELLTFLDQPDVPFGNNLAEREIRPAVILRKNRFGNRSERGVRTQEILMTVLRTLKQRGPPPAGIRHSR